MDNYYIVFQCPKCGLSMTIDGRDAFICKEHGTFALSDVRASIQVTNERGKTQLQKVGVVLYHLIPDLSFAKDIVIQNSNTDFVRAPAETLGGLAEDKRIVLASIDKKQQIEIFRGSKFSKKKFKQRMSQTTNLPSVLER